MPSSLKNSTAYIDFFHQIAAPIHVFYIVFVGVSPLTYDCSDITSPDIEDAQDQGYEQETAETDKEEADKFAHGRGGVRQPLGWRQGQSKVKYMPGIVSYSCVAKAIKQGGFSFYAFCHAITTDLVMAATQLP